MKKDILQNYTMWMMIFALYAIICGFIWLGTDLWFFGLLTIFCAGMYYWSWIEEGRQ